MTYSLFSGQPATAPHRKAPKQMPSWLVAKLNADGYIDAEQAASRRARVTRHTCGAWVWLGIDSDVAGWTYRADTTPLSPVGIALALLSGRTVLHVRQLGGRHELLQPWHPSSIPAHGDAVAVHHCQQPIPETWAGPSRLPEPYRPGQLPETPPF